MTKAGEESSKEKIVRAALFALALLGFAPAGRGDVPQPFGGETALQFDIFVIAHPGVELGTEDLRNVYLGNKQFAGDVRLAPADNRELQDEFLARVLMLGAERYGNLWIKRNFREGTAIPATKTNDAETIEYVRRMPGAVGYVSAPAGGVSLVGKF